MSDATRTAYLDLEDRLRHIEHSLYILATFVDVAADRQRRSPTDEKMMLAPERDLSAIHLTICNIADAAHDAVAKFDASF